MTMLFEATVILLLALLLSRVKNALGRLAEVERKLNLANGSLAEIGRVVRGEPAPYWESVAGPPQAVREAPEPGRARPGGDPAGLAGGREPTFGTGVATGGSGPIPAPGPAVAPETAPVPETQAAGGAWPTDDDEPEELPPKPAQARRPAPKVRPAIDFELRFGRRWAALIGGGVVAFGLALLVRHSIQQGYFPPEVRLAFAAALSLALCAAAEAFRRRGTFAALGDAGLSRHAADVPSVLLGTGLAGVFAVAYAAHAAYGFVGPTTAFAAMAAAALSGIAASLAYGPALAVLGYLAAQGVPFLVVGDGVLAGAAYVALVGVAGYAAAWRGRWRNLENPAGLVLVAWTHLLRGESLAAAALVAVPAAACAVAVTALRLRPRQAWTALHPERAACLGLALACIQGLYLATHYARVPGLLVHQPLATVLGLGTLLCAFCLAATMSRVRPMAPVAAAAVVAAIAHQGILSRMGGLGGPAVAWASPFEAWLAVAFATPVVLGAAAVALHRSSLLSPMTALVGAASSSVLLAAADLAVDAAGGVDRRLVAALALVQGIGLLAAARPVGGAIPAARELGSVAAGSAGIGLLGYALVASGLGDGPRVTLVLAMTAAGAAVLARAWRQPLFAPVAGMASVVAILHSVLAWARTVSALSPGEGTELWPILQGTLLPGLALAGTMLMLRSAPGDAAVREADCRWLSLAGAGAAAGIKGMPASLVIVSTAAGGLLLAALVATVRKAVFGDAYAPLSVPTDIGLACTLLLGGAVALARLSRSTGLGGIGAMAAGAAVAASFAMGVAVVLNPYYVGSQVGSWPGLNLLLLAYLVPAGFAWRLAREVAAAPAQGLDPNVRGLAGAVAVAGILAYATCAVSQAYQGRTISVARVTEAELWTHTAAWLAIGVATLAYGLRSGARVVRLTALGIVGAVAAKVAFVDLGHLTGAARAMSVIALGLVLLGIGMVYQRLARSEAAA